MKRWLVPMSVCILAIPAMAQELAPHALDRPAGTRPRLWTLEFECHTPNRLIINEPGASGPTHYWYVVYRVANPTDREVYFMPRVMMLTDKLELVSAQMAVSPAIYERVKKISRAEFLEEPLRATGRLLTGIDNARDCVAIFPLKEDPSSFRILFGGLSNEQRPEKVPNTVPGGEPVEVTMEKIRVVEFQVAERGAADRFPRVVKTSDQWQMRQMPPKPNLVVDLDAAARGQVDRAIRPEGEAAPSVPPEQPKQAPAAPQTAAPAAEKKDVMPAAPAETPELSPAEELGK